MQNERRILAFNFEVSVRNEREVYGSKDRRQGGGVGWRRRERDVAVCELGVKRS